MHATVEDMKLLERLVAVANAAFDGHLTIYKFTTEWRVQFYTPHSRHDITSAPKGDTFALAAKAALDRLSDSYEGVHPPLPKNGPESMAFPEKLDLD